MASNDDNHGNSPMHLGLTGQFSPEDIQELLGVMGDGSDAQHQHHRHHDQGSDGHGGGGNSRFAHLSGNSYGESNGDNASESAKPSSASDAGSLNGGNQNAGTTSSNGQNLPQPEDDVKAQARSERKRSREKQRRSDVNKQFSDLTQLLQRIDAESINEEDAKNGSANRMTFNPSNRVDLIARTIILLERLHEANKRRRTEISSLQQQLEEAKKAGEDTAAKLKEAMLAPPGQPMNKQFMMMVPMMMSADGSGAAVPMMNPFMSQTAMPQAAMPQPFYQMSHQGMGQNVAASSQQAPVPGSAPAPSQAPAPSAPVATAAPTAAAPPAAAAPHAQPGQHTQAGQHAQGGQHAQAAPYPAQPQTFPYMMAPHMAGGGFMMPMAAPGHVMPGQPMQHMGVQPGASQETQNGQQEQKDPSNGLSGGSNLAHCA